jgi:hypothetical protein
MHILLPPPLLQNKFVNLLSTVLNLLTLLWPPKQPEKKRLPHSMGPSNEAGQGSHPLIDACQHNNKFKLMCLLFYI